MNKKWLVGQRGEHLAREYLEKQGMSFVTKNWSCKMGEIDLVMRDEKVLVFVEVRLRRKTKYGAGYETVARDKIKKLINTARSYQQKEDYWGDVRFDVVSIETGGTGNYKLEHIEGAFCAE